jgi:nitrite reductase/ring-hydroxylating ferredoxin subunit
VSPARDRYLRALPSAELAPGQLRELAVAGRTLVLGRLRDGTAVAFAPRCPHQAGRLAEGTLRGDQIDCPLHHYLFDARSGANTFPLPIYPAWKRAQVGPLRLRTYPVTERDGWIAVDPRPADGRGPDSHTPG